MVQRRLRVQHTFLSLRALTYPGPGHRDAGDSSEPPETPASLLPTPPPPAGTAHALPEPGHCVPFQMGWLIGPHPLSLVPLRTQVQGGLPGAGCGSLSRGPRSAANDDQQHLLQGSPATTVILHISCNTCSVGARGWRGREQPSASAARAPSLPVVLRSGSALNGFSKKPFKNASVAY